MLNFRKILKFQSEQYNFARRSKVWNTHSSFLSCTQHSKIGQLSFVLLLAMATIDSTYSAKIAIQVTVSTTTNAIDPTKTVKTTVKPISKLSSLPPTLIRKQNDVAENKSADNENYNGSINNNNDFLYDRKSNFVEFSILEKDVVDRLVKNWAPIVWLAPEEKFMPLGVEEFLDHVHPIDKEKSNIFEMPLGPNSEKVYLVTNTDIDELLKNEKSFIYGHNPTEKQVPIYAVVTLCNNTKVNDEIKFPFKPEKVAISNRPKIPNVHTSYIPISFNEIEKQNQTIRRSSRLYPVFQRVQRDLSPKMSDTANDVNGHPSNSVNFEYNSPLSEENEIKLSDDIPDISLPGLNKFIDNLADNVKFSPNSDSNIEYTIKDRISKEKANKVPQREKKQIPSFHVTYWMFYPYSQGKTICTLSLGPLGPIPFPVVYGFCLGQRKDIGNHIGDWEHMSIYFNGSEEPESLYVSAHDAGAYYNFNRLTGSFEFKKQETRKGILQRPNFPKTVTTLNKHPVLFAAKGSHGLWTAPGKHRFVKVARLYDINGFGTLWNTWKTIHITYENIKTYGRFLIPAWLSFKGKWGNPKSKCHPFRRIGLNFCEYTDGPTGIPLKESHFQCGSNYR